MAESKTTATTQYAWNKSGVFQSGSQYLGLWAAKDKGWTMRATVGQYSDSTKWWFSVHFDIKDAGSRTYRPATAYPSMKAAKIAAENVMINLDEAQTEVVFALIAPLTAETEALHAQQKEERKALQERHQAESAALSAEQNARITVVLS